MYDLFPKYLDMGQEKVRKNVPIVANGFIVDMYANVDSAVELAELEEVLIKAVVPISLPFIR